MDRDLTTGHLLSCHFEPYPNRVIDGKRDPCSEINDTGYQCACQIGLQSCWLKKCAAGKRNHWAKYCRSQMPQWCKHLSACANTKADELGLSYKERLAINHTTIRQILGLSANPKYNHVSVAKRKEIEAVDENNELSEDSSSDETDNSDEEDDNYNPNDEDSELEDHRVEKRSRDSDSEVTKRSKKRRVEYLSSESESEKSEDKDFIVDDDTIEYMSNPDNEEKEEDIESKETNKEKEEMIFCGECGKLKVKDSDKFCRSCGIKY